MCLYLHIAFPHTDTSHVKYLHTLKSFSVCTNRLRQADIWREKEASVQIVLALWLLSLCTLTHRVGGLHVFPDKQSDSAAFVPGVA